MFIPVIEIRFDSKGKVESTIERVLNTQYIVDVTPKKGCTMVCLAKPAAANGLFTYIYVQGDLSTRLLK